MHGPFPLGIEDFAQPGAESFNTSFRSGLEARPRAVLPGKEPPAFDCAPYPRYDAGIAGCASGQQPVMGHEKTRGGVAKMPSRERSLSPVFGT